MNSLTNREQTPSTREFIFFLSPPSPSRSSIPETYGSQVCEKIIIGGNYLREQLISLMKRKEMKATEREGIEAKQGSNSFLKLVDICTRWKSCSQNLGIFLEGCLSWLDVSTFRCFWKPLAAEEQIFIRVTISRNTTRYPVLIRWNLRSEFFKRNNI